MIPETETTSSQRPSTRERGNKGEDMAADYLLTKGYTIIARQYRTVKGEIDIVAKDLDNTLVFVEVKSASSSGCGNPLFRITPQKCRTLITMAKIYIAEHQLRGPCRFDVIGIHGSRVDHLRNAFLS